VGTKLDNIWDKILTAVIIITSCLNRKPNLYLGFLPAKRANPILLVAFWRVPSEANTEAYTGGVTQVYSVQLVKEFGLCMGLILALMWWA
jgi:hypothetical protein